MAESSTSPRRILAVTRQAQAVAMKAAGETYETIRLQLGYANRSGARKAVVTALNKQIAGPVDELRAVENQRLNAMYEGIKDKAEKGNIDAVHAGARLVEVSARLNGLNAPVTLNITYAVDPSLYAEYEAAMKLARMDPADTIRHMIMRAYGVADRLENEMPT